MTNLISQLGYKNTMTGGVASVSGLPTSDTLLRSSVFFPLHPGQSDPFHPSIKGQGVFIGHA